MCPLYRKTKIGLGVKEIISECWGSVEIEEKAKRGFKIFNTSIPKIAKCKIAGKKQLTCGF